MRSGESEVRAMPGVVFLLLDVGEWLGGSLVWLAEDPQVLVCTACVLFVMLVVLAALGMGAQA